MIATVTTIRICDSVMRRPSISNAPPLNTAGGKRRMSVVNQAVISE